MRGHDSQAYRKIEVTKERISRILKLREIHLSFQTGFNLINAAVVCALYVTRTEIRNSVYIYGTT